MRTKILITMMGMDIGGAETHVLELCRALKRRGLDVYAASNGGAYEKELTAEGITHFRVPMHNKKLLNIYKSYKLLKRIITEHNIRVVHAHARIPAFICGLLQKSLRFTFVTTAHLNFAATWLYKILSNWGDFSLAVSNDIKEYLIGQYNMAPDRIGVTINGIDTEKFSPETDCGDIAQKIGLDGGKMVIGYLSRLDADRSPPAHALAEAAEGLYNHNNNIEILIIGGGGDFAGLRAKADAVNAKLGFELIKMTGPRTDTNKLLMLCDIFVGGGRSALEAMAAAKPVVLAYHRDYLGIFDETKIAACEETNFCCRGYGAITAETLRDDLITMMDKNADERRRLGEYGRETVAGRYSVERMADDAIGLYERAMAESDRKREYDAVISGYYGFKNHGDDALLHSVITDIKREKPGARILVLSRRPRETARLHGVETVNRYNFPLIISRLKRTKLLIFGGGSLIQDDTSSRSLYYYLFIIKSAIRGGARVILYANGIGPLKRAGNIRRAAEVLNKADAITLRDSDSLSTLRGIGVTAPAVLTADAAFGIPNTDPAKGAEMLEKIGLINKPYFCVAVRSWKTLPANFAEQMAAFADKMADEYGLAALFLCMQPQTDAAITKRIMKLMKQPSYFAGDELSVDEALGICERVVFMAAMRLHAAIYAIKQSKPVIGLIYDPKVRGVLSDAGHCRFINVEDTDASVLYGFAREILTDIGTPQTADIEEKVKMNVRLAAALMRNKLFTGDGLC